MSQAGFGSFKIAKPQYALILHPQIPKPLHGVAPRVVLGETWWLHVRTECYRLSNHRCACCGELFSKVVSYPRPEAHEIYDIDYAKGRAVFVKAAALCHWCHMAIHIGMADSVVMQGGMHAEEHAYIHEHRERIVALATAEGHKYPDPTPGERIPWADWRLVIGEREFEPILKSYGEWLEKYGSPTPVIDPQFFDSEETT